MGDPATVNEASLPRLGHREAVPHHRRPLRDRSRSHRTRVREHRTLERRRCDRRNDRRSRRGLYYERFRGRKRLSHGEGLRALPSLRVKRTVRRRPCVSIDWSACLISGMGRGRSVTSSFRSPKRRDVCPYVRPQLVKPQSGKDSRGSDSG